MRVSLIKDDNIKDLLLPNKINGNFWITDYNENGIEENIISIEASPEGWKLISNDDAFCIQENKKVPTILLEEYKFYPIKNNVSDKYLLIYCSPIYEKNFKTYSLPLSTSVSIGNSTSNNINYNSGYLSDDFLTISFNETSSCVTINKNNNNKWGVYVNNNRINNNYIVNNGDVIFIMGLKIIYIKKSSQHLLLINNPNNLVTCNLKEINTTSFHSKLLNDKKEEDDREIFLYSQGDYFHKTPRAIYSIKPLDIKVDVPPTKETNQSSSILLTVGPMITMSMTSMVTGYTAINNVVNNNSTWAQVTPSLVICGAMFASTFLWPLIARVYEKMRKKKNENKRQIKYGKYIEKKREQIVTAIDEQSKILYSSNPSLLDLKNTIINKSSNLWERRIEDNDFLTISLGFGNMPMKIDIKYPEEQFSMVEDNLKSIANKLALTPKILLNVPIPFSLFDNKITAIVGKSEENNLLIKNILLQIMALHSYDDLKIVLFTNNKNKYKWDYLKILPHCWSDDRSIRFFASDNDDYKEICYVLDRILSKRKETFANNPNKNNYNQLFLVITDSFKSIRNFDFIKNLLEEKNNYGFSFIILNDKITSLPDQCQTFIRLNNNVGELFKSTDLNNAQKFNIDLSHNYDLYMCSYILANIPIESKNNDNGVIPDKLGFLEMYDIGKVEQLNALNRWKTNSPILSLDAPVGLGKSGEKISLDLHEKYHGPHGLIAGMTGSGKSEFIITYILSMAVNFHPDEVQFIIIDYKGGGLAGAFENSTTGLKLPHLVGTITNLDTNELKRSLASIDSELKRRQKAFNEARELSKESTIDIYKYQKMYRDKVITEPVSHLFIVVDEFAELKLQQAEFMEQLITTARIGRSLGVHLILATQKPSGVVDPQIWSNTRFRVCMRVQEKSDSIEVIKCPDAALLKKTGRFYLQVGFNEIFVLGQAAWAGGKYYPSEKIRKDIDTSVTFLNNIGYPIKNIELKKKTEVVETNGEELLNILMYLDNIAKEENIITKQLWKERIPDFIKVESIAQKYNYQKENFIINPIIGEYDIPSMQEQRLLTIPFSKEGNAIVFGASGSGKENFITTMIYSSMLYYNPDEINYYIIDFGSEALKYFDNTSIVGDIVFTDQEEKLFNLFKMISQTIEGRKKLFASYNGDYNSYCTSSRTSVANIIVVINNFEAFSETYPDLIEQLVIITRDCSKYGIYFLLACNTSSGVRFKLKQNFSQLFVLQQNSEDDYSTILGNIQKNYPSKIFGRGIIRKEGINEFQTAMVGLKEEIPSIIRNKNLDLVSNTKASKIPVLPEIVTYAHIKEEFDKDETLVVGIDKDTLQIVKYDFYKEMITIISAMDILTCTKFLQMMINQIIIYQRHSLIVIDLEDTKLENNTKQYYKYKDNDFNNIFEEITEFINQKYEIYKNNNYNNDVLKNVKQLDIVIIGVEKFKNKLTDENKNNLSDVLEKAKELQLVYFIFVDSIDEIKKIELESWFKSSVNTNNGIWIGNGINDQFTLKVSQKTPNTKKEVGDNFCFVINRGKPILVKYLEELKINEHNQNK